MDSSDGFITSPTEENSLIAPSSKRATFFATCNRHQTWSLPNNLIYHMAKNPSSSKAYENMIQSCKYFFFKNPILVILGSQFDYNNNQWNARFNQKLVEIKNMSSKIWVTSYFYVEYHPSQQNFVTSIIPKIYKSDAKELSLQNQIISLKHLKFLASKCDEIWFDDVAVMNENKSVVTLEKLVESCPNVKKFRSNADNNITSKILTKIVHFSNLDELKLSNIPDTFDINSFYDYMKTNKKTKICLEFRVEISELNKIRLQTIVHEIITTKKHEYKVPYFSFLGSNRSSADKLWKLYQK